jgi:hypothetical protein
MRNTQTNRHRIFNSSSKFEKILEKKKTDWSNDGWKNEVCPITHEDIKSLEKQQVVLFTDGHLYEKTALEKWLRINPRSPITQEAVGRLAERHIDEPTNQILKIVLLGLGVAYSVLNLFSCINESFKLTAEIQSNPCHDLNALLNCGLDQQRLLARLLDRRMTHLINALPYAITTGVFLIGLVLLLMGTSNHQNSPSIVINYDEVTMPLEQVIDILNHFNHPGFSRLNSPQFKPTR